MKQVPQPVIDKVWDRMKNLSRPAGAKLLEQMGQEQPMVLAYLGSVDGDSLNEGERGLLVYLGMFIWQAMKQAGGLLPQVSEEAMVRAEDATVKTIESLAGQGEDSAGGINAVIQSCGQPELMDLALEALMEAAGYDEEDEGEDAGPVGEELEASEEDQAIVRAENVPLLMLNLKTVVDVLNR